MKLSLPSTFILLLLGFTTLWILTACKPSPDTSLDAQLLNQTGASVDLLTVNYAKGFSFKYENGIRKLQLHTTGGDTTIITLYPKSADGSQVSLTTPHIEVPISNMMLTSTAHVAMIDYLEAIEQIGGVANADFIQNEVVKDYLAAGKILNIGNDQNLQTEVILSAEPEVISTVGALSLPQSGLGILAETGIYVLPIFEWQETSLLARAEWVKVFAALVGKEELVQEKFSRLATRYKSLQRLQDTLTSRPRVLYGTPYRGVWYVPGGKSFVASMLKDAGASYAWFSDSSAVTLPLALEAVYPEALAADYWLVSGAELDLETLMGVDERFRDFRPTKLGEVYANNLQMKVGSGNNIYEKGIMEPDMILADLIKLLHGGSLPEHSFQYYRKLE
ncbi:MAG: ABC transporter substrate-binding protein [Bacteroidota bacterium]